MLVARIGSSSSGRVNPWCRVVLRPNNTAPSEFGAWFCEVDSSVLPTCGAPVTLDVHPHNPNRVQVICSNTLCTRRRQPWGLVLFLKQSTVKRRKAYAPDDGLYDVWDRNGNVYWVCGASESPGFSHCQSRNA